MSGKGQRVGYARVSSADQNPDRQLEQLDCDKLFVEHASGKNAEREQLADLLSYVREGDTIVVTSMDRLARNLDDLRKIVLEQTRRGVRVEFKKENLTFTGEDSPMATLMLSIMGAIAQFERELIKERQKEGIALAKLRGVYRGRKRSLSDDQIRQIRERSQSGEKKSLLAKEFGVSRDTLYQSLRRSGGEPTEPATTPGGEGAMAPPNSITPSTSA